MVGADRAFAQLQEKSKEVCGKPFALPTELEEGMLALVDNRLELYPWEYTYQAKSARETKALTITSPVHWVLSYGSGPTLSQVLQSVTSQEPRRSDAIRQFVVNALVMHLVLARFSAITQLLTDLRYQVRTEKSPTLGDLPLVTISSCLPSFRPADELMIAATGFSGVPAFIELVDITAVQTLRIPSSCIWRLLR